MQYVVTTENKKSTDKDKMYPRTSHEGLEGDKRYSSTLSLTHCVGGWVGLRAGLDR
jgi:hypothetical protein